MANPQSIGRAISYMERHLKDSVSIESIAKASGFSRSTLQRRFLEATNVTVALFLRRLRLNAAAEELVTTKRRIADIAIDYQFESQQTFARAFKQATWLTPGEARRLKRLPDLQGHVAAVAAPTSSDSDDGERTAVGGLMIRGAMIFTEQVEALTAFYRDVIGFAVLDDDPSFTQLDAGGAVLVLHRGGRAAARGKPAAVEITLFASDVEGTRQALLERGAKVGRVALFGDLRLCKVSDPDGNVLGISNRPLLQAAGPLNSRPSKRALS